MNARQLAALPALLREIVLFDRETERLCSQPVVCLDEFRGRKKRRMELAAFADRRWGNSTDGTGKALV